jgi:putative ABC transport system permease protein
MSKISDIDGVTKVQGIILLNGKTIQIEGQEKPIKNVFGSGFDLTSGDKYLQEIKAGEVRELKDDEALLNYKISDAYKISPQDMIGKKITVKDDQSSFFSNKVNSLGETYTFTVVGVIDIGEDNNHFVVSTARAADMQAKRGGFSDREEYLDKIGFDTAYVSAKNEDIVRDIAKQIRDLGFDATTIDQILDIFKTVTGTIQIVFSMFGIIALVVASIGIINTMIMSVYERTREIGVMKAIGASKATIRSLFLTEAAFIGFLGGFLGLIASLALMAGIEYVLVQYVFPAQNLEINNVFTTPLWLMVGPVLFSTFIGMLAGVYPAFRASNLKPVDALRYE